MRVLLLCVVFAGMCGPPDNGGTGSSGGGTASGAGGGSSGGGSGGSAGGIGGGGPGSAVGPRLYFSDGAQVCVMQVDGGAQQVLVPGSRMTRFPTGIQVDGPSRSLWWTDNLTDKLFRMPLDGGATETLYANQEAFSNPEGLWLDLARQRVFFAEVQAIKVLHLDGGSVLTVLTQAQAGANNVVLAADATRMLWTNEVNETISEQVDGGPITTVWASLDAVSNPRGLSWDTVNDRLFWCSDGALWTAAGDGSSPQQLVPGRGAGPHYCTATAFDSTAKRVYWTDNGTDAVYGAGYDGQGVVELFKNADPYSNPAAIAFDPGP